MAYSREIIKKITQYVRFRVPRTEEKDSYYTEIGNTLIRISNHCMWMKVWDNMLKGNPKWQGKPIISIVFEDNGNTFSEENLFSLGYRRRPMKIREYVYNSSSLSKQDINLIIKSLQNLTKSNNFIDLSKKGIPNNKISVCLDYNNIEISSDGIPSKGGYNGADFVPESKTE